MMPRRMPSALPHSISRPAEMSLTAPTSTLPRDYTRFTPKKQRALCGWDARRRWSRRRPARCKRAWRPTARPGCGPTGTRPGPPEPRSLRGACLLKEASYTSLPDQLAALGWDSVDGILLDLGASSMQFDTPERGFSFLADGPLDMRFDPSNPLTAAEIVNTWPEEELADVLFRYGEERASRRIARAIVPSPARKRNPDTGSRNRESPRPAWPPPPRHADLPGPAHRRQRRTGGAGKSPAPGGTGSRSGRQAGGHQLPLAGRPAWSKSSSAGKAGTASARPASRSAPAGIKRVSRKLPGGRSRRPKKK